MNADVKTVAIVPAAGQGKRLGLKAAKPFVLSRGKPLLVHTLKALGASGYIDGIIVAIERSSIGAFRRLAAKYGLKKIVAVAAGGKTRFESVRNCLAHVDASFDIILIHDGARPLVEGHLIKDSIRLAAKYGACVVAVPESDTVKLVDDKMRVTKTLDRHNIYRAQTPQVFRRDLIRKAYSAKEGAGAATDDSALVEALGKKVKVLKGEYRNIKITTKEDLKILEALL